MERKLTNFTTPCQWEKNGKYRISFAYYENSHWTGLSEEVELGVEELYSLLKPVLSIKLHSVRRATNGDSKV